MGFFSLLGAAAAERGDGADNVIELFPRRRPEAAGTPPFGANDKRAFPDYVPGTPIGLGRHAPAIPVSNLLRNETGAADGSPAVAVEASPPDHSGKR